MTTIFFYNSAMSFGLGANHFSVKTDGKKVFWYGGTPQHPKRILISDYNQEMIEDIKTTKPNGNGVEYIRHTYNVFE